MVVFLKNILHIIKTNFLSIFSLVFFVGIITTVLSSILNLSSNLNDSFNILKEKSSIHQGYLNEKIKYGEGDYSYNDNPAILSQGFKNFLAITSAPLYTYNETTKKYEQGNISPITTDAYDNGDPSLLARGVACKTIDSVIDNSLYTYTFVNPDDVRLLATNGHLDSQIQTLDVIRQCGNLVNFAETITITRTDNDFKYIESIFKHADYVTDEVSIEVPGVSHFLKVGKTDTVTVDGKQIPKKLFLIKQEGAFANIDIAPKLDENKKITWTNVLLDFYNDYHDPNFLPKNDNLNALQQKELTDLLQKRELSQFLLNDAGSNLKLELSLTNQSSTTDNNVSSKNNLTARDLEELYGRFIFRAFTYNLLSNNIAKTSNFTSFDFDKMVDELTKNQSTIKNYFNKAQNAQAASNSRSSFTPNAFIFVNYTFGDNKKIADEAKSQIIDNFDSKFNTWTKNYVETLKKVYDEQIKDVSAILIKDIIAKITEYNLITVQALLNNFNFHNPKTQQDEYYKLAYNQHKSIIVTNSNKTEVIDKNQANSIVNDKEKDKGTINNKSPPEKNSNQLIETKVSNDLVSTDEERNHSFKLINTQEQNTSNFVNKLIIKKGNNLFYNTYSNYEILRRWLNARLYSTSVDSNIEKAFVQMVLRSNFSNQKIYDIFKKYYDRISANSNSNVYDLNAQESIQIRTYLEQIEKGQWSYDGYQLIFNFTVVDFFSATNFFSTGLHKIVAVPGPASISNFSADFGVFSESYLKTNNKEPMSNELYREISAKVNNLTLSQKEFDDYMLNLSTNPAYQKNFINIGGISVGIVGIGITSDFAYPALSLFNIIPNPKTEALVYVNENGYTHFKNAFPSGISEEYTAIKYPKKIMDENLQNDFHKQLNHLMLNYIETSKPGTAVYHANDTSPIFTATGYRNSFVDNILSVLQLVSGFIIGIVSILVLFGVVVLIRRYSKNNAAIFGNLEANGVSKITTIFSSIFFILIPSIVGPIIGYFIGISTQELLFGVLNNYWFLDPLFTQFNFLYLVFYILGTVAILGIVALVSSTIALKESALVLMRENPIFKQTPLSLKINFLFNKFSPIWKFRLVVAANSMSRILLLSAMSGLMFIVLVFVLANMGQFGKVAALQSATNRYSYAIKLDTPTRQAGQYFPSSYNNLGETYEDSINHEQFITYNVANQTNTQGAWINNFNKDNPFTVASNINNFYSNADAIYGKDYIKALNEANGDEIKIAAAVKDLNSKVKINPYLPNHWAEDSILSHYFLRSNKFDDKSKGTPTGISPESDKTNFRSVNLPSQKNLDKDGSSHDKETPNDFSLFRGSSIQNNNSTVNNTVRNFNPQFNENVYYSDYVPTVNEDEQSLILTPDGKEFLFDALLKHYAKAESSKTDLSDNVVEFNTSLKNKDIDFRYFDSSTKKVDSTIIDAKSNDVTEAKLKLPLLNRLYRDFANYMVFSIDDKDTMANSLSFLRNKVIIKLLVDHTITISSFGISQKINIWDLFATSLAKASANLSSQIDENHNKFINNILKSKYAPFFVNRFMSRWDEVDLEQFANWKPGDLYNSLPAYVLTKNMITSENSFIVTEGQTATKAEKTRMLEAGLYFIDDSKIVYNYINPLAQTSGAEDPSFKHKVFSFMRPDFLYFVYAILLDPNFSGIENGPIKISFGDMVLNGDYNNPHATWKITGDPQIDQQQPYGLVSEDQSDQQFQTNPNNFFFQKPSGDQSYTYLSGEFNSKLNVEIIGLKLDKRGSYNHLKANNNTINHLLYTSKKTFSNNQPVYPIIINQFAAKSLNANIGTILDYNVNNTYDRFDTNLAQNSLASNFSKNVKLRVVGINDTFYNSQVFISQKNANEILGLNLDYGFNGIFTKHVANRQPIQFDQGLTVYSPSGIYTPFSFDADSSNSQSLINYRGFANTNVHIPSNLDFLRLKYNLPSSLNTSQDILRFFNRLYGISPMLPLINNLEDSSSVNELFSKLSVTLESLVSIVLVIFVPLLTIMVMMVTSLVIDDLKQLSITLLMLGFSNLENSLTIFTYLFPVLIFSLIIGIPLTIVVLNIYINVIYSVLSILLPITFEPWYFFSAIGVLLGIFSFAFLQSLIKLKKVFLPVAMKAMNS